MDEKLLPGHRLLTHARYLRTHQTEAEKRLWYHLRARRFQNLKFRRQVPVGYFIVDFLCPELKLVIEADGGQHGGATDRKRDVWLNSRGYTLLRFWNNEVLGETEAVLEKIRMTVETLQG